MKIMGRSEIIIYFFWFKKKNVVSLGFSRVGRVTASNQFFTPYYNYLNTALHYKHLAENANHIQQHEPRTWPGKRNKIEG